MMRNLFIKLEKNKHYCISMIVFVLFAQFIFWILYDGITGWEAKYKSTDSVDYVNLKKYLSNWYSIFFLTDQTSWMFLTTGLFYFKFYKSQKYKTVFFCTISYMVFDIFALTHFNWSIVDKEIYGSYKSLTCHLVFPVVAFAILFWIRKEMILKWKQLFICSFYLTIFYLITIIIYYSVSYIDSNGELVHLKIYKFLDFNRKVMGIPTKNIIARIFVNVYLVLLTPFAGFGIFIVFKLLFFVNVEWFPIPLTKHDKLKIHNIYIPEDEINNFKKN